MARWLEGPDSTHPERVALEADGLVAIEEVLDVRVGPTGHLGRTPVVAGAKTTDRCTVEVQLVQFTLAGQIPVALPSG